MWQPSVNRALRSGVRLASWDVIVTPFGKDPGLAQEKEDRGTKKLHARPIETESKVWPKLLRARGSKSSEPFAPQPYLMLLACNTC